MRDVISGCACFVRVLLRFNSKLFNLCFNNLLLRLSLCLFVFARSVVNTQHSIGCFMGCLVVFSWYDVITCEK